MGTTGRNVPIWRLWAGAADPAAGHDGGMTFSAGTCESCGRPTHERIETGTGRLLCQGCFDTLQASSAAVMTGGGAGEAIAIRGWMRRARAWRLGRNQGRTSGRPDERSDGDRPPGE